MTGAFLCGWSFLSLGSPLHFEYLMEPERTPTPGADPVAPRRETTAPTAAPLGAATTPTTAAAKPDHLKRFLAKLVDGIIASLIFWLLTAIIPGWFAASLIGALAAGTYWIVCDGLEVEFMRHRSLGKKLIGLDVIRTDGAPMNIETSARRNWMFAIGWFTYPFGAILGLLISLAALVLFVYEVYKVFTEPDAHRWGDELAGTRVVEV